MNEKALKVRVIST